MGRPRAARSPSNWTGTDARAATGGRKRITVPASPHSSRVLPLSGPGVMSQSGALARSPVASWTPIPRARSASAISSVSRERSGRRSREVPLAKAANTRNRLVSDLLPRRTTVASTGLSTAGAGQSGEGIVRVARGQLGLAPGRLRGVLGLPPGALGGTLGPPAGQARAVGQTRLALGVDHREQQ